MPDEPIRVAFCPLLYESNGGTFDKAGKPIIGLQTRVRGKCDRPYECVECPLLTAFAKRQQSEGLILGWECPDCLKQTKSIRRWLPGYFSSSKYRGPPEDRVLWEPERELDGCTRCGYGSMVLQLVMRQP